MKNSYGVLIYPLYIIDGFSISQYLCTKSNIVLYPTAFLNFLSAKVLHTRYGIVTLYYHVLKLYVMASTLLDILSRLYGQKILKIRGIRQVHVFS